MAAATGSSAIVKGQNRVVAVGVFFGLILEYLTVKGF